MSESERDESIIRCCACSKDFPLVCTLSHHQGWECATLLVRCDFGKYDEAEAKRRYDWRQPLPGGFTFEYTEQDKKHMDSEWQEHREWCMRVSNQYRGRTLFALYAAFGSHFDSECDSVAFVDETGLTATGWKPADGNDGFVLCDHCVLAAFRAQHISAGSMFTGRRDVQGYEASRTLSRDELVRYDKFVLKKD